MEALVGWLLDHPDIHVTELSDAETVSDEYSDEEVLEELEEAEPPFPAVSITVSLSFWHLPLSLQSSSLVISLFCLATLASRCSCD